MPLPSGGGTWPPQHLQPIYNHLAILDAWYQGDPDRLAAIYTDPTRPQAQPANHPWQHRGGLSGLIGRMFWGQPTPAGEKRTKLHVPVASDIATMSSDLLFSEPPTITVENTGTQERIDDMLPQLQATLLEGSEVGAALGGYYLRAAWDRQVAEQPWLAVVHADAAVPEWRWGRLWAVTFWRILETDDQTCYLHLERHEPGLILNGLYVGAVGSLGKQLPLTDHPETASLQPTISTGLPRCTATYIANMRPQRQWRNFPAGASLGRSDFDGPVMQLMDSLDETWTSWMRDIRIGKGRVHVPRAYLQNMGKGQGAYWDPDREIYEALDVLGAGDKMELTATQFEIRVVEHRDTVAELLSAILRSTGYSAQSFGLSGEVAVTATEVSAKERRSLVTRGRKALYTAPELADAIEMLLALEASLFSTGVTPERPTVVFGDSVSPDIMQLAQTAELMRRAEAASDETLVRMLHPDWDEEQVQAEVDRIADARPEPVADPFALPGEMVGPGEEGQDPEGERQDEPPGRRPAADS